MKNILKTFEPNISGRDFVIGDLHGAMPCFENLLKHLKFDETKDRMFSVGDLIDRGPESLECLRLIRKPWFHCVKANHEQMMIESFSATRQEYGQFMAELWFNNGGTWAMEAWNLGQRLLKKDPTIIGTDDEYDTIDLLNQIQELPYLITVNMVDGTKYHIIHAELPPGEIISDQDLSVPERVAELATIQDESGESFLWGRYLFRHFHTDLSNINKIVRIANHHFSNKKSNENLSHVISGHTILEQPLTILGRTCIDTGAYKSCREDASIYAALTCVELNTWTFYQATPESFRIVKPFVLNKTLTGFEKETHHEIDN